MSDARETAVNALFSIDKGQWNENSLFDMIESAGLDKRDAGLCTAICEGVLQNRMLIDSHIEAYSSQKLNKISPYILNVLRSAVYQIEFLDRIPVSAAVNTAVNMARKSSNPKAAGFVNAVLRKIARNYKNIPLPEDEIERLSIKYSHPKWIVEEFLKLVGRDEIESLLIADNSAAKINIRVNFLKSNAEQVIDLLNESGWKCEVHPFLENAFSISGSGNPAKLESFKDGLFTVQDTASQICVEVLAPKNGGKVLDLCAAPGGKSFAIAAKTGNDCRLISCDINEKRLEKINADAERLGVDCIKTIKNDGTVLNDSFTNEFDYVLADVPCSGMGDIRRKPEIRYKNRDSISKLPEIQYKILENAAKYVKNGGILIYSTCSILPAENTEVVKRFLSQNYDFTLEPFSVGDIASDEGYITLFPHRHGTDGFFIAKLRKRK